MLRTGLIALTLVLCIPNAAAAMVELRPVADTTLHQISPNNNMGAHTHVAIGETAQLTAARGLFRFDFSTLPSNAVVSSVSLTFNLPAINRPDLSGSLYAVHRMLRNWGEGNKSGLLGAPAAAGEPTWLHSALPATWDSPGGDFNSVASATEILGPSPGTYSVDSTAGLVSDVQSWITNAEMNFGWLVKVADESVRQTARQFASRETANGAILHLEYSAPMAELRITAIERADTNVVIRWTGGQGTVAVESMANLNGSWEELGESSVSSFTNALSSELSFFRLKDE
jgi:hypothetical protein